MTFIRIYQTYLKRAVMVWMVSLVLFVLAYIFVLRTQNNSREHLENALAEQRQLYASTRRAAQEQTRIQLNEQIERLRDRLNTFAINLEEFTDLTFDISQIANREKLASFSVTSSGEKRDAGRRGGEQSETRHIKENLLDIEFTAGFHQFATFVNALERHRPVLFIDEFKITSSRKIGSGYQATLEVAAFVRQQQNTEVADEGLNSTLSVQL